ncbi:MAG TPA: M42 family metallopeptidase [Phototrophicaceae bacterium]|jgi:endoglucanase|nr:M42 family metallopeptidase [Phototrophicaceae bacterium]
MMLKELSEAVGVSGQEEAVRQIILKAIEGHAEQIRIDPMGSVTAFKPGTGAEPRLKVMIAAHMDEVGFMVTGIDSDGYLRFTSIGGIDDRILPGLRVRVGGDLIPGVILWTPIHQNQDQNVVKMSNLRIDIGAKDKDEASHKVKRADRVAFDSRYMEIGEKMLRGKSFDDRVGCSLLIDVLQGGPYSVDVLAAFTVQEEVGLRGALVAGQTLNPDVALVLEGTTAQDIPNPLEDPDDGDEINPTCRLGSGPALTVMDRSMITNPRLFKFLKTTAEKHGIPYQIKSQLGGGTDAGSIHITNGGVPSAVMSVPCRYIHSPSAYLNRDDYASTLKLAQAFLNEVTTAAFR